MHQIIWGGGHGLDRAELRNKPPAEVEEAIRTSPFQTDKGKGRWSGIATLSGYTGRFRLDPILSRPIPPRSSSLPRNLDDNIRSEEARATSDQAWEAALSALKEMVES